MADQAPDTPTEGAGENAGAPPATPPATPPETPPAPKPGPPVKTQKQKDDEELAAFRAVGLKPSQVKSRIDAAKAAEFRAANADSTEEELRTRLTELQTNSADAVTAADTAGYDRGRAEAVQAAITAMVKVQTGKDELPPSFQYMDWNKVPKPDDEGFAAFFATLIPTASNSPVQGVGAQSYGVGGARDASTGGLDSGAEAYRRRHAKASR